MEGKFFRQRYIALVFTYIVCRSDFATEISRLCTVYSKRVVNERHGDVRSESRWTRCWTSPWLAPSGRVIPWGERGWRVWDRSGLATRGLRKRGDSILQILNEMAFLVDLLIALLY